MPTKKAARAKMAIYCLTKTYPRPHVESNHDLAFRKRSFYPLNYRGGIKTEYSQTYLRNWSILKFSLREIRRKRRAVQYSVCGAA